MGFLIYLHSYDLPIPIYLLIDTSSASIDQSTKCHDDANLMGHEASRASTKPLGVIVASSPVLSQSLPPTSRNSRNSQRAVVPYQRNM